MLRGRRQERREERRSFGPRGDAARYQMREKLLSIGDDSPSVATGSIDSRELKNNSVRSKDIRNNDARSKDVRNRTRPFDLDWW